MARLLLAKMASAAALVSTSFMLSSCSTTAGRPVICDAGYTMKAGRCAKVTKPNVPPPDRREAGRGGSSSHY